MATIKLTKEQKTYLFKEIFNAMDLAKIFETTNTDYLTKQNITLRENSYGWYDLYWDKELYTSLNPFVNSAKYNILIKGAF